jgi:hypothetical protein
MLRCKDICDYVVWAIGEIPNSISNAPTNIKTAIAGSEGWDRLEMVHGHRAILKGRIYQVLKSGQYNAEEARLKQEGQLISVTSRENGGVTKYYFNARGLRNYRIAQAVTGIVLVTAAIAYQRFR